MMAKLICWIFGHEWVYYAPGLWHDCLVCHKRVLDEFWDNKMRDGKEAKDMVDRESEGLLIP